MATPIKGYIGFTAPEISVCSDCGTCELVCATYHEGATSPALRRIWLQRNPFKSEYIILACKQCNPAPCMAACPVEAISEDKTTGAKIIDESLCIGCEECTKACPLEPKRISFNREKNVAIKCDLCDGRAEGPACIQFCPNMCLELKH
jgi:Fe-S-cluster-containing hydrogenase component 2